jgi:hypothetical protein
MHARHRRPGQLRDLFQGARLLNRCSGFPAPIKGRKSAADRAHLLATGPPALPGRAWTWSGGVSRNS